MGSDRIFVTTHNREGLMKASRDCLALIEASEGFRSAPYLCPAGIATIGFGSTFYEDGTHVTLKDAPISRERAESLMLAKLAAEFEPSVNQFVKVAVNQGKFDALVDFAYNMGCGALKGSTLLRKLNLADYVGAADQFDVWVHSDGRVLPGLVERRAREKQLFLTGRLS